jgi:hypothetical protein
MAEIKTKPTGEDPEDFLNKITDEQKRKDCFAIMKMMQKASKEKPRIWGNAMIGFGDKRYKSAATGREVDWFLIGFAPRKANISIYFTMDIQKHAKQLAKLGKHKTGVGCLYINKLDDVDTGVLNELIVDSLTSKNKL